MAPSASEPAGREQSEPTKPSRPSADAEGDAAHVRGPSPSEAFTRVDSATVASEAVDAGAAEFVSVTSVSAPQRATEGSLEGARFYVVQSGDSLWSIAKRLLGRDASSARIAREVHRLWSLNEARIATGDPDLLRVGTELRLR